jgi:DNA-binding LytR/AlgR family response regulator
MKAIIIEDEKRAANHLIRLIQEVDADIEVINELQTINQSVEWFRENSMPDIVFLDIHLADGSSFEIFKEISIESPIIFTTAYDEYALKAFEVNSVDYLLNKVLPLFRQLFFKDKLDFFSRPIGREKKSKQLGGTTARVVYSPTIDVAA